MDRKPLTVHRHDRTANPADLRIELINLPDLNRSGSLEKAPGRSIRHWLEHRGRHTISVTLAERIDHPQGQCRRPKPVAWLRPRRQLVDKRGS